MIELFETEKKARNWFYSELLVLGGLRSYDFCKYEDYSHVFTALNVDSSIA